MPATPATQSCSTPWALEVVRGRDVGKVFALEEGEVVLGNGLDGSGGLDLRDQEAGSPRRMAARQASVEIQNTGIVIRDLESPGGTFVNRQRLLSGQARLLKTGDEIQLGGVLLRVAAGGGHQPAHLDRPPPRSEPIPAAPAPMSEPYAIAGRVVCRTWDDFLVLAAQRWSDLRDELESGRLADYLTRIRRTEMLPRAVAIGSPDDRLDEWLGRLPASRSTAPELDVHPASLEVRSTGGTTRHVLKIANVGYRLLRSTAQVDPAGTSWVKLLPPYDGRPFDTVEQTQLTVEVTLPESTSRTLGAEVVIDSNGGTRRIPVRVAKTAGPADLPDAFAGNDGSTIADLVRTVASTIRHVKAPVRIGAAIATMLALRSLVVVAGMIPLAPRGTPLTEPRLPSLAVLCAAMGMGLGLMKCSHRAGGGLQDITARVVASGFLGILAATLLHAVVKTVEQPVGAFSSSPWAIGFLWAVIGAAVAGLSCLIMPCRGPTRRTSP